VAQHARDRRAARPGAPRRAPERGGHRSGARRHRVPRRVLYTGPRTTPFAW
jgi:hypothetical protein